MVLYALVKASERAVKPPKGKVRHQECGQELSPASNGRMACAYCLKVGYLMEAPGTRGRR